MRTAIAAVLGRAPEDGESFVDAGGDSLSYVEVSVRLERLVGPLPAGWHTMPVEDLEALGTDGRRSAMATVDTGIVLRALAIVLVVGTHAAVWEVRGGAHALLAVAGYNFARFQLRAHGPLTRIARIALPSAIWIGGVVLVGGDFTWTHALLVNGFLGGADARWAYWFVEALVQILVVLALLFAVPAVVRWERRRPFGVAAAALAAGMLVRFDVVDLTTDHRITRPHEVFWLFALGWAAARATGVRRRVLVTLAATVAVAGFFDDPARELVVLGSVLLIGWLPAVRLPRTAVPALAALAAASLWIYLTHVQLLPLLRPIVGPGAATAMSLAVGVAAHRAAAAVRVGRMRTS